MIMKNISPVVNNYLCTGCGGCSNICPKGCISIAFMASKGCYEACVNEDKCISCGLCQNVCPVYTWNNSTVENRLLGNSGSVFSVYANDMELRYGCASGGFTTTFLIYALEHGYADAVVAVTRDAAKPLYALPCICTSKDEVLKCKGSVYAPTSYVDVVKKLQNSAYQRIVVVGLPCHIQTLSRLEKSLPGLKGKIIMKISLVCGHTPSLRGYEYSLRHLKIDEKQVRNINNRGDGWPGYLKIDTCNGDEIKVRHGHRLSWGTVLSSPLFTPDGCAHCVDPTGYAADISVSDAWLSKFKDDKIGRNLIYVRSDAAMRMIDDMCEAGVIAVADENMNAFVQANDRVFKEKLIINGVKNRKAVRAGLFGNMTFLPIESFLGRCAVRIFIMTEKAYKSIFGVKGINRYVLFLYKAIKYLSVKWLKIYC